MADSVESTGGVERRSEAAAVWQEAMSLEQQLKQLITWTSEIFDKPYSELSATERRTIRGQFVSLAATVVAGLDVLLGSSPTAGDADLRKLMISVLAKIDPVSPS